MFNLGYFKESKIPDPKTPIFYKKPIYYNTLTSEIKSNTIYLDNLTDLLNAKIEIRYLNTDEKVIFKSTSTVNQIEYTLTAYFNKP